MQTDFRVEWVLLPAERQGEWRHAIELIAEIIKEYVMTIETTKKYRFVWRFNAQSEIHYGSFLFDDPADAITTHNALKTMYPVVEIWLEDNAGNKIELQSS